MLAVLFDWYFFLLTSDEWFLFFRCQFLQQNNKTKQKLKPNKMKLTVNTAAAIETRTRNVKWTRIHILIFDFVSVVRCRSYTYISNETQKWRKNDSTFENLANNTIISPWNSTILLFSFEAMERNLSRMALAISKRKKYHTITHNAWSVISVSFIHSQFHSTIKSICQQLLFNGNIYIFHFKLVLVSHADNVQFG